MTEKPESPIGQQKEQALVLALQELSGSLYEFKSDLNNINDSNLRDTAEILVDGFGPVIETHLAQPKFSIADDIASLMSGVLSLRIPKDDEVGGTPSRKVLRRHVGLLVVNLNDAMVAAANLGIHPTASSVTISPARVSRDNLNGKIEALKKRLADVEHVLTDLESAGHSPTSFRQQSGLLNFYIASMRVEINLTKFQLNISKAAIDLASLTRTMEVMAELTRDFVETARSWRARLASGVNSLVGPLIFRFRKLARGVSTIVKSIYGRPTPKVDHTLRTRQLLAEMKEQQPNDTPSKEPPPSLLTENVSLLRRYARALMGPGDIADEFVKRTLETLVARYEIEPFYVTKKMLYAEFSRAVEGRIEGLANIKPIFSAEEKLRQLPPFERQVFLLASLEGFSVEDMADILQLDQAKVEVAQNDVGVGLSRILKTRVLIIEDELFIGEELAGLFTSLGHDIIGIARTASEAVALASSDRPGLISADIQLLDGSSGLDAVNEILRDYEVPVIFVTAYPERFLTAERPEPAFLISKPFIPSMVAAVASQALFFNRRGKVRSKKR